MAACAHLDNTAVHHMETFAACAAAVFKNIVASACSALLAYL